MEACGGAHYWYREISRLGHTVQLLPAHKVKPYVDGNKNYRHDAAAICEAMSRPSMRLVLPKSPSQQDLQSLHRARGLLVARTDRAVQSDPRALARVWNRPALAPPRLSACIPELLDGSDERLTPILRLVWPCSSSAALWRSGSRIVRDDAR